jgi:Zn-dependent membrane protease YugP
MPMMYGFSGVGLLVALVGMGLTLWAQMKVRSAYTKYSQVGVRSGVTGADIARRMMQVAGITNVGLEITPGQMTDHYDPRAKVVRLSQEVYHGQSVASLGIAAHEIGHVIQDAKGYAPMHIRSFVYPVSSLGTMLGFPLAIVGLMAGWQPLVSLGILLFAAAVVFTLITLPVEFNASRRAMVALADGGVMTQDELHGARKVLTAAALTYVAAAAVAVMNLLHLLSIAGGSNREE